MVREGKEILFNFPHNLCSVEKIIFIAHWDVKASTSDRRWIMVMEYQAGDSCSSIFQADIKLNSNSLLITEIVSKSSLMKDFCVSNAMITYFNRSG